MDRNELQRLAEKFLDGTATAGEKQLLNQWYDTANDNELLEIVYTEFSEIEVKERILENIKQEIHKEKKQQGKTAGRRDFIKRLAFRISSAAAVIFIAAGLLWQFSKKKDPGKVSLPDSSVVNITAAKITKITLPDGSLVWLNAHSVFKYPDNFKGKVRGVELLEGRAFFDVKHENDHPFVVKTKSMNIIVLGTSFDVRTYAREGTTKVSVISGKVGIIRAGHANEPAIMLLPKQQVIVSQLTSEFKKEPVKEAVVNLWCKSPLVFEQENLNHVFKAIEKQYNTHIQVSDKKLLDERISITLSNQRLDTIMEILSFTKHFNYQIANDSTVVIK